MAKVLRSKVKRKKNRKATLLYVGDDSNTDLPMEYEEPINDMDAFSFLIHGEKKVGKTTLALQTDSKEDKVLTLQFDPAQRAYRRMEIVIRSYGQLKIVLKKLTKLAKSGRFPYKRIILDGAQQWYQLVEQAVCEKLVINTLNEGDWGEGYILTKKWFNEQVDRILDLPCGRWFLAHSSWKEVETHEAETVTKLLPVLDKRAEEILNGKVDAWFAYDYVGDRRVLFLQGNEKIGAGHRLDQEGFEHFRTPKGRPIQELDMGDSPREAYANLVSAFNNEIPSTRVSDAGKEKRNRKRRERERSKRK